MNEKVKKGSYILVLHLPAARTMLVGSLGETDFQEGWYAYVGSAMGGLQSRLAHHLREKKKLHWHVDYLLQAALIDRIITFESVTHTECRIAQRLIKRYAAIPGFGCSDCKCQSHLFYSTSLEELQSGIVQIHLDHLKKIQVE